MRLSGSIITLASASIVAGNAQQQIATNSSMQSGSTNSSLSNAVSSTFEEWKREQSDFKHKGAETNGLTCAVEITRRLNIRQDGVKELSPIAVVNILNVTNVSRYGYLNLPKEAVFQLQLFDSAGKEVEKTATGTRFKPWTDTQIRGWLDEQLRSRAHDRFFFLYPWMSSEINEISLPEIFQLKAAGEYTIHLRLTVVRYYRKDESGDRLLETTHLPEVVAPVQVFPQDIIVKSPSKE